jgi:hypothetical protein
MNFCQAAKGSVAPVWRRLGWLAVLSFGCHCPLARAATPPRLDFDIPFCIGCRVVPCAEPAKKDLGKDLIEVVIPISVRVRAGTEKDLKQCLYTLVDPTDAPTLSVRDWLPRTELKTEFAKPIQVNKERLAKVGITLSAHYAVTASGDATGQIKSGVAYEMLPPQEIVLASGTMSHGHGVFFKLRPCTQTTLEGMKSFSVIFAVPQGWRGGWLRLRCQAVGLNRGLLRPLDREVDSGRAAFCVALYVAGDGEAEALADRVAACQQELLDSCVKNRRRAGPAWDKSLPLLGRWSGWPWSLERHNSGTEDGPAPDEPALLHDVLDRATTHAKPVEELPRPVRRKLRAFQQAMKALQHLSGGDGLAVDRSKRARRVQPVPPLRPTKTAVSADGAIKPASATAPSATAGAVAVRAGGPIKEGATGAAGLPAGKADGRRDSGARPSAGALLPRSVGSSANTLASASDGNQTRAKPTTPSGHACKPGRLPKDSRERCWYLLASVGGAVFTCILAPVVVEIIRRRINAGRQHRPSGQPTRSLPSAHPRPGRRRPTSSAVPMLLVPPAMGPHGPGVVAKLEDAQARLGWDPVEAND